MVVDFIFRQVDQLAIDMLNQMYLQVKKEYLCVVYSLAEVVKEIQRWLHARLIMIQLQMNLTFMLSIQIDMFCQSILSLINKLSICMFVNKLLFEAAEEYKVDIAIIIA